MQVQLRAGLPQGEANGLKSATSEFVDKEDPRLVLALVSPSKYVTDADTGEETVQLKVRRVELVVDGDDVEQLQRIMLRAHERRTGQTMLPFDTEQAIEQAFREFALGTTDSPQQTDHVPGYSNGDQHEQEPPQAGRDFSIDDDPGRDDDGPWPGDPGFSG
jgi:hypothetical protein